MPRGALDGSGQVVLELPLPQASEPLAELRPAVRLRVVNSGCQPRSEGALIELVEVDHNVVPGVVDAADPATAVASHSGVHTVTSKDSSPGASAGPMMRRARKENSAGSAESVDGSG